MILPGLQYMCRSERSCSAALQIGRLAARAKVLGPDLHFFLMLGTFLLFISHLFLLGLGDISGNFSVLEVLWSLVGGGTFPEISWLFPEIL